MSQEPKVTRFGVDPTVAQELATKAYVDGSSGGGQTFARIVKKVDEIVNNSSTLQDDDELLFAANANKTYGFMIICLHASNTTPDIKIGWSGPAGFSMEWETFDGSAVATLNETQTNTIAGVGATTVRLKMFGGRIIIAGTAGNLILQWAQNTANATDTTMFQGSYFVIWEEL